jgi:hypothetical protein
MKVSPLTGPGPTYCLVIIAARAVVARMLPIASFRKEIIFASVDTIIRIEYWGS